MQRHNSLRLRPKSPYSDCPLETALKKPEDRELFYTASLHFLNKRLQEKTHRPSLQESTQSCCDLNKTRPKTVSKHKAEVPNYKTEAGPSLPMHQVLPFPKSSKEGFFNRMKNTFRKYRQSFSMTETNSSEELEISKSISNFKFPRCERPSAGPSGLVKISEENSNESFDTSHVKYRNASSSRGDILESTVKTRISR